MRIVLDTAALITALRSRHGAAAEVLRLILLGKVVALMDYKLSMEYRDVALRSDQLAASGLSAEDAVTIIAEPIRIDRKPRPLSSDPNDDMVLDIAINGQADLIVTNNKRHFNAAAKQFKIAILSPPELLEMIGKEK